MNLLVITSTFWWIGLIVFAFASAVTGFNIESAWQDAKKGRRGLLIGGCILFGLAAIGFLIMVTKTTN